MPWDRGRRAVGEEERSFFSRPQNLGAVPAVSVLQLKSQREVGGLWMCLLDQSNPKCELLLWVEDPLVIFLRKGR